MEEEESNFKITLESFEKQTFKLKFKEKLKKNNHQSQKKYESDEENVDNDEEFEEGQQDMEIDNVNTNETNQ